MIQISGGLACFLFVFFGCSAIEDFLTTDGECEHFVFAFVHLHRGYPTDTVGNHLHPRFAVGNTSGEQDGVDLAVDNSCQAADFE